MTLSLHFDNRLDRLADSLAERLVLSAVHPLAEHAVVVPSLGVGRWLQQQLALRQGVSARVKPELAGRLLWRLLRQLMPGLPARSPFDPAVVRWRLLAIFDALPAAEDSSGEEAAGLDVLRERLSRAAGAQRLAVATEVAMLFDRYLAWRRDWLDQWQHGRLVGRLGPHEAWQAWLWRRLLEAVPGLGASHPYERFEELVRDDRAAVAAAFAGQSISILGMPAMSPSQFELFGLLGQVADVAFFAPDPCRELWEDLAGSRTRARVMATHPEVAWLYEGEPSVLGDWGRGQRDFIAQVSALQDRFGVQAHEPFRTFEDPDEGENEGPDKDSSCLHALRTAVFLRSDEPWKGVAGADASIAFHATHSPVRQAEVLHDALLECFTTLPQLRPSEIAVFCADIESAAPAIDAVFGGVEARRRIPVTISGRPPQADPLLRAVLDLPGLALRGPDAPAVEAWLLNPAVAEATGLPPDQVVSLMRLLEAAGARWGLDAEDGAAKHNWQEAFDRLLIGSAVASDVRLVGDLAPTAGLRGSRAALLEPLLRLFEVLRSLRHAAATPRPVTEWCARFADQVESFFGSKRRNEAGLGRLREALAELAEAAGQAPSVPVDLQAFEHALQDALRESAPAAAVSGAVTVCPIGALRGIPFRVVCLFGMDEGAFPRRNPRSEADLMLRAPRFGDRHPRTEERGAFLDAVLAARKRLLVLFKGRDVRDDAALYPSPVVLELLDYLRERLGLGPQVPLRRPMPALADASAIVEHPLHPFAPRAFGGAGSFAREWEVAARALAAPMNARLAVAPALVPVAVPAPSASERTGERAVRAAASPLTLELARRALADPIAWWLRQTARLALLGEERSVDRLEPLWPEDGKDSDTLDRIAQRLLAGEPRERLEAELRATPHTAGGAIGERHARHLLARASALLERAGGPARADEPIEVRWTNAAGGSLFARLAGPGPDRCLRLVSGYRLNLHGLIDAWLRHALLGARVSETILASVDARASIRIDDPHAALGHALDSIDSILAGPPAAFPRAWLAAWRRTGASNRDESGDARRLKDIKAGIFGGFMPGEIERPAQAAFWRDETPDLQRALAEGDALWRPILASIKICEAEPL
jgi:exodeoxyribonuclease V gamma subunit